MYEWELEMDEISGMSEDYEKGCRRMVKAGMDWFDRNPEAKPLFSHNPQLHGVIYTDNEAARELQAVMVQSCLGCTGAMFQASLGHVLHAHKVEEMSKR